MRINSVNSISLNGVNTQQVKTTPATAYAANLLKNSKFNTSHLIANYTPFSFKGSAPNITNACIVTEEEDDLPLLKTQENNSYIVDFDSQTEIIYGVDAIKHLEKNDYFQYDTQVIFPKDAQGILKKEGKEIPVSENSAIFINKDTNAKVEVEKGYPMIVLSKKDYDWYERYSPTAEDINIQNKFLELMYFNSHLYNGDITPNTFLPQKMKSEAYLNNLGINKGEARNDLVYRLYSQKDLMSDKDKNEITLIKSFVDKLYDKQLITGKDDGYIKFTKMYSPKYYCEFLKEQGFTNEEITLFLSAYKQAYQVKMDSKFVLKNPAKYYRPELVEKMKQAGIIHKNQKDADENIYWIECMGNEHLIREKMKENNFSIEEQEEVLRGWREFNNTGFDISGLKYIDDDTAVYNLDDKLNNWTHEKTNWVTNSTSITSKDRSTPFIGTSMVQYDKNEPIEMKKIRKGEKLHRHPNFDEKRQTEVYLITDGTAALNIVKKGKTGIKLLKAGELAVISPNVAHCVNSVDGKYEHICIQVPSAFQYGYGFKMVVDDLPEDYDEERLTKEAFDAFREE